MGTFAYTAVDQGGRRQTGTVSADTRPAALEHVERLGLVPVKVVESSPATRNGHRAASPPSRKRVGRAAVDAFTRELSNLLAAGLPLSRALHLLRREASNPAAARTWSEVHDEVVGGTSLADALAKHPSVFPPIYIAMVRAGETGGFLHVVLQQIADFRAREQDLKGKVKAALIYPCVLSVVAVAVLVFLLTFFIPRFSGMFEEFGSDLPLLTRGVVAVSNGLFTYGPFILIALVVAVVFARRALQKDDGRRAAERAVLRAPLLGVVLARFALVRFCRMLGTLVAAGVPLVAALRVAKEAIGNQTLADTVGHAIHEVQRGAPLSRSLATDGVLFPPSAIEMISVAEETGRLDQELVRLSQAYEADMDRNLRMLVALAEPAVLFVMAALIGTVVIGMLLPVFTLQDLIQ
jgi:type II secretory pathway component PulF